MDREELNARFREEALERVDAIVAGLLALEREDAAPGTLDAMFREAHSVKGGAGMMGLEQVAALAHRIEDVLAEAREAGSMSQEEIEALLRQSDALRTAIAGPGAPPSETVPGAGERAGEQEMTDVAGMPGRPEPESRPLRVAPDRIDRLLDAAGEAVLHQRRIDHLVRRPGGVEPDQATEDELDRGRLLLDELQDSAVQLRMLPLDSITSQYPRAVRDLAVAQGKDVELVIGGAGTQLDRTVLGAVSDPVTHLLRNAVAHGIESPRERKLAGKPPRGRIELRAEQRGERVLLHVSDDGRGVAPELLRLAEDRPLAEVLAEAGVSTAEAVTDVSGRGVGLDAVQRSVQGVAGDLEVRSTPGHGTAVTLILPVSLALVHALLAERAGAVFAFPLDHVDQVVAPDGTVSLAGRSSLEVRGAAVPLTDLNGALGGSAPPPMPRAPAIVLALGGQRAAVVADRILGEQELLIRGLGALLAEGPGYDGCAVLGDGRVAFLVNTAFVLSSAGRAAAPRPAAQERLPPKVLVVDDQLTVRELQRSILESAGYRVATASDGVEARDRLAEERDIDLVVTDIEMPGMDGFELLESIRSDAARGSLPVVMVSSRGSEDDRRRGLEAGADAYIGKDSFAQEALLGTVARLVGR